MYVCGSVWESMGKHSRYILTSVLVGHEGMGHLKTVTRLLSCCRCLPLFRQTNVSRNTVFIIVSRAPRRRGGPAARELTCFLRSLFGFWVVGGLLESWQSSPWCQASQLSFIKPVVVRGRARASPPLSSPLVHMSSEANSVSKLIWISNILYIERDDRGQSRLQAYCST